MAETPEQRPVVREKQPNADFGVYFNITNGTSNDLELVAMDSHNKDCTQLVQDIGTKVPHDGKPHQIHLYDPCSSQGADGRIYLQGTVSANLYYWDGACPVWSSSNSASGPGIQSYNSGGHPLTVTIYIDDSTPVPPPPSKK